MCFQRANELSQKIINEGKETIKQLENKIQDEQQLIKKLEDKNTQITKGRIAVFNFKLF